MAKKNERYMYCIEKIFFKETLETHTNLRNFRQSIGSLKGDPFWKGRTTKTILFSLCDMDRVQ